MTAGDRYVVLGLAHARSTWFRDVARWATAASVPCEFVKCVSVEEARARLGSGRPFSALLLDGSLHGVDRDLVATAADAGCTVLVVDDGRVERDWAALGAAAVLPASFDRDALVRALRAAAAPISRHETPTAEATATEPQAPRSWSAPLVVVTGPGGTGVSTISMALAQGLADEPRNAGMVLLADLARHAEQAMYHDARDVVPGLHELVDAHRAGQPGPDVVRGLTFDIAVRRYHLLLGARRAGDWTALRRRAVEAAIEGMRASYRFVVVDVDADVEGEAETGALEIEERNLLARTTLAAADVVLVAGHPGPKGTHALARTLRDVIRFCGAPERMLPIVNLAPRSARRRAEIARALAALAGTVIAPVFLPERKRLDDLLTDVARLPQSLTGTLAAATTAVLERAGRREGAAVTEPMPVRPGSLGVWAAS